MKKPDELVYKFDKDGLVIQFDVITFLGSRHTTTLVIIPTMGKGCYIKSDYKIIEDLLDTINDGDVSLTSKMIERNQELSLEFLHSFIRKLHMINSSINEYLR